MGVKAPEIRALGPDRARFRRHGVPQGADPNQRLTHSQRDVSRSCQLQFRSSMAPDKAWASGTFTSLVLIFLKTFCGGVRFHKL